MAKCDCKKCIGIDDLAKEEAYNAYHEQGVLEIEYQDWTWECGHCSEQVIVDEQYCSACGTKLIWESVAPNE